MKTRIFTPIIFAGIMIWVAAYNLSQFENRKQLDGALKSAPLGHPSKRSYEISTKASIFSIYQQVKQHFTGWRLIGFSPESIHFTLDGPMNYIGPSSIEVKAYSPDLTVEEGKALTAKILNRIRRPGRPQVGVVAPPKTENGKVAIALRAPGNIIILVASDMAPRRFAWIADDR